MKGKALWTAHGLALVLVATLALADDSVDQLLSDIAGDTSHLQRLDYLDNKELLPARPSSCLPGDMACKGQLLGYTDSPSRNDAGFLTPEAMRNSYEVDPDMEPGTCKLEKEPVLLPNIKCQTDMPLHRNLVALPSGSHTSNADARPYMHVGERTHYAGSVEWRSTTLTFDVSLANVRRFELLLLGSNSYISRFNGLDLSHFRPYPTPVCYVGALPDCVPLTLGQLEAVQGIDLTRALVDGRNTVLVEKQWPNDNHTGALFRIVRVDEAPVPELPACGSGVVQACVHDPDEDECGQLAGDECLRTVRTLSCPDSRSERSVLTCGPPVDCADGACAGPAARTSHAGDIGEALARLEAVRQEANYLSHGDWRVFRGFRSYCRSKVGWGLGTCCRPSGHGGQTSNKQALAQLGISHALRGVLATGSPHTHDSLFLVEDLASGLKNLGISGAAATFSPSLSFYGLEVAVSEGALTFGFDPASFAVAIGIAIIANMLACTQEEKIVSMKRGAGLCETVHEWCSKKRLFTCKEKTRELCCYNSRLSRIVSTQAKAQLRWDKNVCTGFTVVEFDRVNFEDIDLSEFARELNPSVDSALLDRYIAESKAGALDSVEEKKARVTVP